MNFWLGKKVVSDSKLEHLSYRTTSTSFGPFSWEHASRLKDSCHDLIEDFWKLHGNRINRDIDYWPDDGTFRCHCCARPFKSAAACKSHLKYCANRERNRTGSSTDEFIMNGKRNQILSEGKSIKIGDTELETVSEFKYLGQILKYDGSKRSNLLHRKHKAQNVFKALYRLWYQEEIYPAVKFLLYQAFVISTFTYGCETWILDKSTTDFIRSFNSRNLHSITCRGFDVEFNDPSIDLLKMIKQRRANWLHSTFLGDPNDPLTKSLYFQNLNRRDGDIFSDFKGFEDHESFISKLKSPDWKKSLISDKNIFYAHDTGIT